MKTESDTSIPKWQNRGIRVSEAIVLVVLAAAAILLGGHMLGWSNPFTGLWKHKPPISTSQIQDAPDANGMTKLPPPDCSVTPCWPHSYQTAYISYPSSSGFKTYDWKIVSQVLANPVLAKDARIGHTKGESNYDVIGFRTDALKDVSHDGAEHRLIAPSICYVYPATVLHELGAYPGGTVAEIIDTPGLKLDPNDQQGTLLEQGCHGAVIEVGSNWSTWVHA